MTSCVSDISYILLCANFSQYPGLGFFISEMSLHEKVLQDPFSPDTFYLCKVTFTMNR